MSSAPDSSLPRTDGEQASSDGPALPDGTPFRLLENRRRRYLVYCLLESEGKTSLSSAVDLVTAWESDCPVEEIRSTDRRCVYSTLRRTHLPKLESEGVVVYDPDAGTVSLGPEAETVTQWLAPDDESRWSTYYLVMSGLVGVCVVPEFFAVVPVLLPQNAEHVPVASLFAALTAVVAYDAYRKSADR